MLFIIETEFTYWFAALRAYFLHLDKNFEQKHSKKKPSNAMNSAGTQAVKEGFLKEWSDQDFFDTLILAGCFVKKKLLQVQIQKFEMDKSVQNN